MGMGGNGYRRIAALLRADGWRVNVKRVHRLWKAEGLQVRRKQRKRRRLGNGKNACHRRRPRHKEHVWGYDLVELPITALKPFPVPLGLGYMRLFGKTVMRGLMAVCPIPSTAVIYIHMHDLILSGMHERTARRRQREARR